MRDMMLVSAAVLLLVSEAWSRETETNYSTAVNASTNVVRNVYFSVGSDVDLSCSNKTWDQTMYVIWKIPQRHRKECKIGLNKSGHVTNTCPDGKSLRNTSTSHSNLHIPHFSPVDVGMYNCELVFSGGKDNYDFNVAIIVPPSVSAWIEHGDKRVAVCRAEGGTPAANISWSCGRDPAPVETRGSGESVTVESRLELDEGEDTQSLTCAVTHPSWEQHRILVPKPTKDNVPWPLILTGALVGVLLLGLAFFVFIKFIILRCRQQSPSKSPQMEDAEEVEPYASYIQRVNSIYN